MTKTTSVYYCNAFSSPIQIPNNNNNYIDKNNKIGLGVGIARTSTRTTRSSIHEERLRLLSKISTSSLSSLSNNNDDETPNNEEACDRDSTLDNINISSISQSTSNRRNFLSSSSSFSLTAATFQFLCFNNIPMIEPAEAKGLVRFPSKNYEFSNVYHMMRAGESLLEENDIWTTNPLFLTNRNDGALSEKGEIQVLESCRTNFSSNNNKNNENNKYMVTLIKYSLAANVMDTANLIGQEEKLGRDKLVPEYSFMDPRAIGNWDMSKKSDLEPVIWALDNDEAGPDGRGGRPPPNEDGTPNETLSDQVTRLRQFLSSIDTNYSGENILMIFPDGTSPALLTCLIGGIPLNRVHELEYAPGEIRFDITYERALEQLNAVSQAQQDESSVESTSSKNKYQEKLELGRKRLKELRENPDVVLNVKDLEYEEESRKEEEEKERQKQRLILEQQQEKERKEKERKKAAEQAQAQQLEKERKMALTEKERKRKEELSTTTTTTTSTAAVTSSTTSFELNGGSIAGITVAGVAAAVAMFSSPSENNNDDEEEVVTGVSAGDETNTTTNSTIVTGKTPTPVLVSINQTDNNNNNATEASIYNNKMMNDTTTVQLDDYDSDAEVLLNKNDTDINETISTKPSSSSSLYGDINKNNNNEKSTTSISSPTPSSLYRDIRSKNSKKEEDEESSFNDGLSREERAMKNYLDQDDGAEAFTSMLAQMMLEEEEDED